jgi:hypothetical protein
MLAFYVNTVFLSVKYGRILENNRRILKSFSFSHYFLFSSSGGQRSQAATHATNHIGVVPKSSRRS